MTQGPAHFSARLFQTIVSDFAEMPLPQLTYTVPTPPPLPPLLLTSRFPEAPPGGETRGDTRHWCDESVTSCIPLRPLPSSKSDLLRNDSERHGDSVLTVLVHWNGDIFLLFRFWSVSLGWGVGRRPLKTFDRRFFQAVPLFRFFFLRST